MKPTLQTNHNLKTRPSFPFADYNYQSTLESSRAGTKVKRGAQRLRGFWKLGTQFHGGEAVYGDAADFFVFTLIGLACTWPVFSVGKAIYHVFYG